MIRIQIGQVPLLVLGAAFAVTVLRWLSLHVGLRAALRTPPPSGRRRLCREFARAHRVGLASLVLGLRTFHAREGASR